MMIDSWQFLLVFSAVVAGWLLGRYKRSSSNELAGQVYNNKYYKGLNYLLNDQPDEEIDSFISSLEVNGETLEMHLAVGNLMRRKGEVDRAIRTHQNLLARSNLTLEQLHLAHLELARDYISAGLWDRAEGLLEDLLEEAPEIESISKRHLMEIYQDEKEWEKAVEMARQLLPKRSLLKSPVSQDGQIAVALSHYCCELAELDLAKSNYLSARSYLKQALNYDPRCVRASMLAADLEYKLGHYSFAIKQLKKVVDQDPVFVPEIVVMLHKCYSQLDDEESFLKYLSNCLDRYPSVTLLLTLADKIKSTKGTSAASEYLGAALKGRPSLRGLAKLVELNIGESADDSKDSLVILQLLIEQLMHNKPQYQCHNCGFSGKKLHWLCPSCTQWGKIKAIRGAEGD
jgi:lipopolysaccharide biosynthesis regulator YciM